MEPTRHRLTERWEIPARKWAVVVEGEQDKKGFGTTDDDDLPLLSRLAARSERSFRLALVGAWETVNLRMDERALLAAVERGAMLDIERHLLLDLSAHLMGEAVESRLHTMFRHGLDVTAWQLRQAGIPVRFAAKQLEPDLARGYEAAARWARAHAGELITHITARQREAVARLIARANQVGISPDEVARRLRRIVGLRPDQADAASRFSERLTDQGVASADVTRRTARYMSALQRDRAMLISRTELVTAANAGQQELWNEALRVGGLPRSVRKRWITTPDELLCDQCEALGEQDAIPVTQEFAPGVMHPGLHPACRCAMALEIAGGR